MRRARALPSSVHAGNDCGSAGDYVGLLLDPKLPITVRAEATRHRPDAARNERFIGLLGAAIQG